MQPEKDKIFFQHDFPQKKRIAIAAILFFIDSFSFKLFRFSFIYCPSSFCRSDCA